MSERLESESHYNFCKLTAKGKVIIPKSEAPFLLGIRWIIFLLRSKLRTQNEEPIAAGHSTRGGRSSARAQVFTQPSRQATKPAKVGTCGPRFRRPLTRDYQSIFVAKPLFPDGLQQKINDAALAGEDFSLDDCPNSS